MPTAGDFGGGPTDRCSAAINPYKSQSGFQNEMVEFLTLEMLAIFLATPYKHIYTYL